MNYLIKKLKQIKHFFFQKKVIDKTETNKKTNPYELLWYKQGISEKEIRENNTKYWQWEMEFNNFKP